jgi:hypothetical protein
MSNKKLSGAQLRKRKREQEADAKKYGLFMQQFLKQRPAEDDDSDESDMDKLGQEAVTVTDPPECHQLDDTLMTSSTLSQPETSESDSSTQAAQFKPLVKINSVCFSIHMILVILILIPSRAYQMWPTVFAWSWFPVGQKYFRTRMLILQFVQAAQ